MAPGCGDAERHAHVAANIPETSSSTQARTDSSARCDNKRARPPAAKGRTLKATAKGRTLKATAKRRAPKAAGRGRPVEIVIDRLADYSNKSVLEELRRVAALVKQRELTVHRFVPLARISHSAVNRRFGCWKSALLKAGLGDRASRHWTTDRRLAMATKAMSDRQIVRALRAIARRKQSAVLTKQDVLDDERLSVGVLLRRFGPWAAVVATAGLRPSPQGHTFSRQACIDNLIAIARHTKRLPRREDLRRPPSTIRRMPYVRIFGSWRRALQEFIEIIEENPQAIAVRAGPADPPGGAAQAAAKRRRRGRPPDRRRAERTAATAVMRFRILARDRFRCVLCGDSPAVDPRCKLHVDHIVPFSKGGRTTAGNLRTLCAACNIGRGNRGEDARAAG